MASRRSLFPAGAALAVACLTVSCRPAPPPAIDPELAACLPSGMLVLAGLHLDRLRSSQTFQNLAASSPLLEPLRPARDLLLAYDGRNLLLAAQGAFPTPPAGAVLLSPTLAIAGSPDAVRAATAQHATGRGGAPALLSRAAPVAASPIWAVAEGGVTLPLAGNASNLNRLLQLVSYATATAQLNSEADLAFTGACPTAGAARQLEETLRALASLGAATRDPNLSALFRSVQVRRDNTTVHAALSLGPDLLNAWLRDLPH